MPLKLCIVYEPPEEAFHMTLNLTLPAKFADGPVEKVIQLFVNHFEKKHGDAHPLVASDMHLVHRGQGLLATATVSSYVLEEELLLVHGPVPTTPSPPTPSPKPAQSAPAQPAAPGERTLPKNVGVKVKQGEKGPPGTVRCKRLGCNQFFHPQDTSVPCSYHAKAPVFHETAKWWNCCSNRKAYDWEEFMSIPGCLSGFCTQTPPDVGVKALGGTDMRNEHAPIRLDGPEEVLSARKKLEALRAGLVACGVDEGLFDRVWGRLAAKSGDLDVVVAELLAEINVTLERI